MFFNLSLVHKHRLCKQKRCKSRHVSIVDELLVAFVYETSLFTSFVKEFFSHKNNQFMNSPHLLFHCLQLLSQATFLKVHTESHLNGLDLLCFSLVLLFLVMYMYNDYTHYLSLEKLFLSLLHNFSVIQHKRFFQHLCFFSKCTKNYLSFHEKFRRVVELRKAPFFVTRDPMYEVQSLMSK